MSLLDAVPEGATVGIDASPFISNLEGHNYVGILERGECAATLDVAERLAQALGVVLEDLIGETRRALARGTVVLPRHRGRRRERICWPQECARGMRERVSRRMAAKLLRVLRLFAAKLASLVRIEISHLQSRSPLW